jgi:hypothetical protein
MNEWLEENFLEKFAGNSAIQTDSGLCAEAEALCAEERAEGGQAPAEKFSQHIASCAQCADLHRRLVEFDQPGGVESDAEVMEAERRLDAWLKGLLSSPALQPQGATLARTGQKNSSLLPFRPKWSLLGQGQWGLTAAAILAIAFGVVYLRRSSSTSNSAPVAAQVTPAEPSSSIPSNLSAGPVTAPAEQAPPNRVVPKAAVETKPTEKVSASKNGIGASSGKPLVVPERSSPPSPAARPPIISQDATVAENAQAPAGNFPVRPSVPPSQVALSKTAGRLTDSGGDCQDCKVAPKAAVSPITGPPIQIEAGTRIFISIESTSPQNDGRLQFAGRLLLPVSLGNSVVLEKGTPVAGIATTSGGKTSVQVTEFAHDGNRYKVRNQSGEGLAQSAGGGTAIQFDSGKVVEMWLERASVFEATEKSSTSPPN